MRKGEITAKRKKQRKGCFGGEGCENRVKVSSCAATLEMLIDTYETYNASVFFWPLSCMLSCLNLSHLTAHPCSHVHSIFSLCSSDLVLTDSRGRQVFLLNKKSDRLQMNLYSAGIYALIHPPSGSCPSSKNVPDSKYEHCVMFVLCAHTSSQFELLLKIGSEYVTTPESCFCKLLPVSLILLLFILFYIFNT